MYLIFNYCNDSLYYENPMQLFTENTKHIGINHSLKSMCKADVSHCKSTGSVM